ncbi:MAG TPA: restriction endonuclease [Sedimentisphaerales bacterium]|nr:restriction endonuclease [Sedimentisphaerales bacterium]
MALWVIRAGSHGEYEQQFLTTQRVYLTWKQLNYDLRQISTMAELRKLLKKTYDYSVGALSNYSGQIWAFYRKMDRGDWVIVPSKLKRAVCIAEITGEYKFDARAEDPYYHYRDVKWIATDIPRSNFDQDLLYSFGAFRTVSQVQRNDAENRVRAMAKTGWKRKGGPPPTPLPPGKGDENEVEPEVADLEQLAQDQIAKLIITKFKGHGLARLVDGILRAQGYTTYISAEGPDKGIDILAGQGTLGFGEPRICVQVKSGDSPLDRPTLDQLLGTMQNVQAQQGLLVSWGGFKASVDREEAIQFFRVRLWDQKDLIEQLLAHYDRLDEDVRADLPLKHIWTVAKPEGESE